MRAQKIRPFRQGDLDGFCGVYSVINAIHAAAGNCHDSRRTSCPCNATLPSRLGKAQARDLFHYLARYLERTRLLAGACQNGLDTPDLKRILSRTHLWMRRWHDLDLVWSRARIAPRVGAFRSAVRRIKQHLSQPHTAVIVAIEARVGHWSVISECLANRLRLADSDGGAWLPLSNRKGRRYTWHAGCIDPTSVFLVQLQRLPGRRSRTVSTKQSVRRDQSTRFRPNVPCACVPSAGLAGAARMVRAQTTLWSEPQGLSPGDRANRPRDCADRARSRSHRCDRFRPRKPALLGTCGAAAEVVEHCGQ